NAGLGIAGTIDLNSTPSGPISSQPSGSAVTPPPPPWPEPAFGGAGSSAGPSASASAATGGAVIAGPPAPPPNPQRTFATGTTTRPSRSIGSPKTALTFACAPTFSARRPRKSSAGPPAPARVAASIAALMSRSSFDAMSGPPLAVDATLPRTGDRSRRRMAAAQEPDEPPGDPRAGRGRDEGHDADRPVGEVVDLGPRQDPVRR